MIEWLMRCKQDPRTLGTPSCLLADATLLESWLPKLPSGPVASVARESDYPAKFSDHLLAARCAGLLLIPDGESPVGHFAPASPVSVRDYPLTSSQLCRNSDYVPRTEDSWCFGALQPWCVSKRSPGRPSHFLSLIVVYLFHHSRGSPSSPITPIQL